MARSKPLTTTNVDIDAFLKDAPLNSAQKAFCKDPEKKIRLLAPAGNGKTHSLLWRCLTQAQLAGPDNPQRFLIFSFTRPARDELVKRLDSEPEFRPLRGSVEIFTLNGWGNRRLKTILPRPQLKKSSDDLKNHMWFNLRPVWMKYPKIKHALESGAKKNTAGKDLMLISDNLKGLGFRHDQIKNLEQFKQYANWLRSNEMEPSIVKLCADLAKHEIVDRNYSFDKTIDEIFKNYFKFWRESTQHSYDSMAVTFDDQKYWSWINVDQSVKAEKYTSGIHRFHHVLVDEFQDINILDLQLLKSIAAANKTSLCIVGDDDQAIYEWRGAIPNFLLDPDRFVEDGYKTHILNRNYRSPQNIVEISQTLIRHNERRVEKNVEAESKDDALIELVECETFEESVEHVVGHVKKLLKDRSIKNIALVGRRRSQIIPYQIVFASEDIPFCAAEDLQIFLSTAFNELKELLTFKAQMDTPAPFGPEPIQTILRFCHKVKQYKLKPSDEAKLKAFMISKHPRTFREAMNYLYEYDGPLKGDNVARRMSQNFFEAIAGFFNAPSVSEAINSISDNFEGLQKNYSKSVDDIFYLDPPFPYLGEFASKYGDDYGAFYLDIEKAAQTLSHTPIDGDDEIDETQDRRLHLMTALRAKGKQFDAVVILDCNQSIYPSKFADTEAKLEAERRLFYVAVTRARKQLLFVVNDEMFGDYSPPSQFIDEMGIEFE